MKAPSLTDITLEFDSDSELAGAVIRCKAVPLRRIGEFDELDLDGFVAALASEIILSWNLEDDRGETLPVSVESFADMPTWVPMAIRNAWNRGLLTPPKRQ